MLYLVKFKDHFSERINEVLTYALAGLSSNEYKVIESPEVFLGEDKPWESGDSFLFSVAIPENGFVPSWYRFITEVQQKPGLFDGTKGALIVDGEGELHTKDTARKLIFSCNTSGMRFPGKPLVEATGSLYNFTTSAKIRGTHKEGAYKEAAKELVEKLLSYSERNCGDDDNKPKEVVVLHASARETSNSLMLWELIKNNMLPSGSVSIEEISVRNGEIVDCRGCGFETCRHFGEKGDCFYGGVMVDKVYPAVLSCDALVLVCPNYNDAVSANMMAMFNRLTALFYNNDFSRKEIYALVVSGYSGGDIVAQQIIGVMNINKGFDLPPYFALLATANDPGAILETPEIETKAKEMADRILAN